MQMKRFSGGFALSLLALAPLAACAQKTAPKETTSKTTTVKEVAGTRPKLSWAPPVLVDPITVEISNRKFSLKLDQTKDYIIKMPPTPLQEGIRIWGGHNIVLIGGEVRIPSVEEVPEYKGSRRALYLNQQTGTAHIEGLLLGGKGLHEGINLDQRKGATVQLQNVRVEKVHGGKDIHHADVIQTWGGPAELHIDRLTGTTGYQGFFLLPNQHFKGDAPRLFDFRHINLIGDEGSAYMLWRQNGASFPLNLQEVWLSPNPKRKDNRDQFLWPKPSTGDTSWVPVNIGTPPDGDFVPEGVAGLNYTSPGYVEEKLAPVAALNSTP